MEQQVEQKTNKNLLTSTKYAGLAAAMAAELMIGFWFGIGAILAVKSGRTDKQKIKSLLVKWQKNNK